jgi:hypothetical protein
MDISSEKLEVTTRGETHLTVMGVKAFVVQPIVRDEEEIDADFERMIVIVTKDSTIYLSLYSWNREDLTTRRRISEQDLRTLRHESPAA